MMNVKFPRRQFLHLAAGAAALPAMSRIARAQSYPTRPVTLIVPQAAGGAADVTLRALANATEKHLGQKFVIENKAGAGATLGTTLMAAIARPDGYTVSGTFVGVFRLPFLTKTTFDPAKDLTYIISVGGFFQGVVVRSDARWQTLQELLGDAKANPGKITVGLPGAGTNPHIVIARIAKQQGINWVTIQFRGNAETNTALLGGHVDAVSDGSGWGPLVQEGKFRLLATYGAERGKKFPNAPTLREAGIDMDMTPTFGISGPRGMDPKVIKVLHDAFKKGMEEPSFSETLDKLDEMLVYRSSEEYHAFAMNQIEEERRLVIELGLKAE